MLICCKRVYKYLALMCLPLKMIQNLLSRQCSCILTNLKNNFCDIYFSFQAVPTVKRVSNLVEERSLIDREYSNIRLIK